MFRGENIRARFSYYHSHVRICVCVCMRVCLKSVLCRKKVTKKKFKSEKKIKTNADNLLDYSNYMSDNDDDDDNIPASHSFIAHFIEFHSLFCTMRSPKKKKFSKTNSLHNDRLSTITIEFSFWDNNTNHEHMNE